MSGKNFKDLSTFQFGLILLIVLTVFTGSVGIYSFYGSERAAEKISSVPGRFSDGAERPFEVEVQEFPDESNPGAPTSKKILRPELPENFTSDQGKPSEISTNPQPPRTMRVTQDPDLGEVVYYSTDEEETRYSVLKKQIETMVEQGLVFRRMKTPENIKSSFEETAKNFWRQMSRAEDNISEAGQSFFIEYSKDLDRFLIQGQQGFLKQLVLIKKLADSGAPECARDLPSPKDFAALPKFPSFEPKSGPGNDGTGYYLPPGEADPIDTIDKKYDLIERSLECVRQEWRSRTPNNPGGDIDILKNSWKSMKPDWKPKWFFDIKSGAESREAGGGPQIPPAPVEANSQWPMLPPVFPQSIYPGTPAAPGPDAVPAPADEKSAEKESEPKLPEGAITPTFVESPKATDNAGIWGPLQPGELPPTPTPAPTPKAKSK